MPTNLLNSRGAVCPEVASAMAEGSLARSPADMVVAVTGVAGPDPDEDGNPVGLVCIAVAPRTQKAQGVERRYGMAPGERIQEWAMADALATLLRVAAAKQSGTLGLAAD